MERKISESGKPFYVFQNNSFDFGFFQYLVSLASALNKTTVPLINSLLTTGKYTIKDVVSFSSTNGLKRLKKRFLAGIREDSPYYSVGVSFFNDSVLKHPEFDEIFNKWRFAKLLTIDKDGLVTVDKEAFERRNTIIVRDPKAVAYLDKLSELCALLNEVIPPRRRKESGNVNILREVILYNKIKCQFEPLDMYERTILKYIWEPPGKCSVDPDTLYEEMANKDAMARADREDEEFQKDCGLSASDLIPPAPEKEAAPTEQ